MLNSLQLQQLFIGFAILASTGTMVQDTKLNKALELSAPLSTISVNVSTHLEKLHDAASAHTHVERFSLTNQFAGLPRIQARTDHRRYMLPKHVRGLKSPENHTLILRSYYLV